jgi:hypothetical protein
MEELQVSWLHKDGSAIVVYVEGLGTTSYESKSYDWDLGLLKGQLGRRIFAISDSGIRYLPDGSVTAWTFPVLIHFQSACLLMRTGMRNPFPRGQGNGRLADNLLDFLR